ncbi:MAG: ribosome small subunit-dependent GTPase A [Clostridia bacterium]|nr:ribosome small subunit-dependent GTPase A [Clostridia bacterium]
MADGIIVKGIGGFYYVRTAGGEIYETHAAGRFRKEGMTPLVGDRVVLTENCDAISDILERKCSFVRPPVANIDQMIVVLCVTSPKVDLNLADKFLLYIETKNVDAVICINKSDIADKNEVEKIKEIYEKSGYKVIVTSAEKGLGAENLRETLKGKISAFAGNSGVGKSSLLNLIEKDFALSTGEVSKKILRGKHTTRHVELLELSFGGYVLDTPGFGKINLPLMEAENVQLYFREFKKYIPDCRHRGCMHTKDTEGCAVLEAVENGKIAPSRYESYLSFCEELKDYRQWKNKKGLV